MPELNTPEPDWGLCDHNPFLLSDYQDDEDYDDDWDDHDEDEEDDEPPGAGMARLAAEIKAGRAQAPPGWRLDRPAPGVLVWTIPSGRRYAFDLTGEYLPLPGPRRAP